jgi:hypothetical protein
MRGVRPYERSQKGEIMTRCIDKGGYESSQAILSFLPKWEQQQDGDIKAGDEIVIEYSRERIYEWPRHPPWNWEHWAHICFHPGGKYEVRSFKYHPEPSPNIVYRPVYIMVPAEANRLELWFEHRLHYYAEQTWKQNIIWDSRFGQNYWFEVTR